MRAKEHGGPIDSNDPNKRDVGRQLKEDKYQSVALVPPCSTAPPNAPPPNTPTASLGANKATWSAGSPADKIALWAVWWRYGNQNWGPMQLFTPSGPREAVRPAGADRVGVAAIDPYNRMTTTQYAP